MEIRPVPVANDPQHPEWGGTKSDQSRAADQDQPKKHIDEELPDWTGRVLWIKRGDAAGSGTAEEPFGDLQAALDGLEAGDRLIVLPGRYEGPYRVGPAAAGAVKSSESTKGMPTTIEIVVREGATFSNAKKSVDPVWSIGRDGVALIGAEIQPGLNESTGVLVEPGVTGVRLAHLHIKEGSTAAIEIAEGASNIRIEECHLHQLGLRKAHLPAPGIRIACSARDVVIDETKVHHVTGELFEVCEPGRFLAKMEGAGEWIEFKESAIRIHNEQAPDRGDGSDRAEDPDEKALEAVTGAEGGS